jgi:hypothetical protein
LFTALQGEPHAPQFDGSLDVSMHAPLQQVSEPVHGRLALQPVWHWPSVPHVDPDVHSVSVRHCTQRRVVVLQCGPAADDVQSVSSAHPIAHR